jgi:homogentisate 1,2-dioxygenase
MMNQTSQNSASSWHEEETLWYLGGMRIIEALETQRQRMGAMFEYLIPANTSTFSYAPTQEDTAIYVVAGEADFVSGEATIHATPGMFLFLPRPVGFRSATPPTGSLRMLTWTTPLGFAQRVTCMGNAGEAFVLAPPPLVAREKVEQFAAMLRKLVQPF